MAKYGMPYKGSKDKIAEKIISVLPEGECFCDLFDGGGAVTDCALQSGKYKKAIYNEIEPLIYEAFKKAVHGDFKNESRWISREDFFKLKDTDPYVAICFSFGNGLRSYAYSPEIERFKKHLHYIFFADTPKEARLHWKAFVREFAKVKEEIEHLTETVLKLCEECKIPVIYNSDGTVNAGKLKQDIFKVKSTDIRNYFRNALKKSGLTQAGVDRHLDNQMSGHYFGSSQWALPTKEQYEKMKEIIPALDKPWAELNEKLSAIKGLDELQSLEIYNLSYEQVKIPNSSVIYCDIPYYGASKYKSNFDYEKFYKWALNQDNLVFVSEYSMPEEFHVVAEWEKTCSFSRGNSTKTVEKLFCNKPYKI